MTVRLLFIKGFRLCKYIILNIIYFIPKIIRNRKLVLDGKEVILFCLPKGDWFSGGILSIFYILDKSEQICPQSVVLPVVFTKLQRYFRTKWFKSPYFIYNLLSIRHKLLKTDKILIHVPECFYESFCKNIIQYSLQDIAKKSIVNVLNQNQESMPSDEIVTQYKGLFKKLTMTLAFEVNQSIEYPFLDNPPQYLGSGFYGDNNKVLRFEEKENICIISPDNAPYKREIIQKLKMELGLKCIEIRNMPFPKYCELRNKAKWAVSFGEGYDGYVAGTIMSGGMGFGVYNKLFFPDFISSSELPINFFSSYKEMYDKIVGVIKYMQYHIIELESLNSYYRKELTKKFPQNLVEVNLKKFYQNIDFN